MSVVNIEKCQFLFWSEKFINIEWKSPWRAPLIDGWILSANNWIKIEVVTFWKILYFMEQEKWEKIRFVTLQRSFDFVEILNNCLKLFFQVFTSILLLIFNPAYPIKFPHVEGKSQKSKQLKMLIKKISDSIWVGFHSASSSPHFSVNSHWEC